jgi:histidine phosphotransferase ChpT
MPTESLDLASLLCSRLCHDMLSPVGALSNGLELLADEKLKFFRLAFGAAGGFGDMVPVAEARAVVDSLVAHNDRIELRWALGGEMLPKPAVKTMLNLALIGIEALVRGGTLDIGAEIREGASEIVIRAAGKKIAFDPAIGRALDGSLDSEGLTTKTAPAVMIRDMAVGLGGGVQFALSEDALVMGAVLPVG